VDFQFDSTRDGRVFKIASMVDEHSRVSLLDITNAPSPARPDRRDRPRRTCRGLPKVIRADNGPELVPSVAEYCALHRAGQPWLNGYAESPNNRCRDERLNQHEFDDLISQDPDCYSHPTSMPNARHPPTSPNRWTTQGVLPKCLRGH
jgi:hypothetical protein